MVSPIDAITTNFRNELAQNLRLQSGDIVRRILANASREIAEAFGEKVAFHRKAFESGMTMRGFILNALRNSGLKVTDADLVDRRRR